MRFQPIQLFFFILFIIPMHSLLTHTHTHTLPQPLILALGIKIMPDLHNDEKKR